MIDSISKKSYDDNCCLNFTQNLEWGIIMKIHTIAVLLGLTTAATCLSGFTSQNVYTESPKNSVSGSSIVTSSPEPDVTPTIAPAETPVVTPTATPSASPVPTATATPDPDKDNTVKTGWVHVSSTKKYYLSKKGKALTGYQKIGGSYYYFNKKTTYAVCKKWKYVSLKGKKYKLYFGKSGKQVEDPSKILGKSARYQINVSLKDNMITIFAKDGNKGYTVPVKAMICSVGMPGHQTRTGTYSLTKAGRWHPLRYNSNGQYATRYSGPYLFHSVTYNKLGDRYSLQKKEFKKLGTAASHGCIRLQVIDAKWIYEHSGRCTAVIKSKISMKPFTKPEAEKIKKSSKGYYDPTDPEATF